MARPNALSTRPPGLGLPVVLEGQPDLLLEHVRHEGLVVGAVLALHLHQQLVVVHGEMLEDWRGSVRGSVVGLVEDL